MLSVKILQKSSSSQIHSGDGFIPSLRDMQVSINNLLAFVPVASWKVLNNTVLTCIGSPTGCQGMSTESENWLALPLEFYKNMFSSW